MSSNVPSIREDDMVVNSGRVSLPKRVVQSRGLSRGDLLQVALHPDGDESPARFSATLRDKYRITVPARFRDKYDIEDGDRVDIEVFLG